MHGPAGEEHDRRDQRELHHRLSSTEGTQFAPKTACAMTANSTGAVRTVPTMTRRVRSAISTRSAAASSLAVGSAVVVVTSASAAGGGCGVFAPALTSIVPRTMLIAHENRSCLAGSA